MKSGSPLRVPPAAAAAAIGPNSLTAPSPNKEAAAPTVRNHQSGSQELGYQNVSLGPARGGTKEKALVCPQLKTPAPSTIEAEPFRELVNPSPDVIDFLNNALTPLCVNFIPLSVCMTCAAQVFFILP